MSDSFSSRFVAETPLIFDVGMNVGDNIGYYLKKGYRVVGIDANPTVVTVVEQRYRDAIAEGVLVVLNCGIGAAHGTLPFHVNDERSVFSSFAPPSFESEAWRTIDVPVRPLSSVVAEFGSPAFMKIDVEGLDAVVLHDLLAHGMASPSISVEVLSVEPACTLVAMGYQEFQLVNCANVGLADREVEIHTLDGGVVGHRFALHSAGPFGDDLPDAWVASSEMLLRWLAKRVLLGGGWYDLHARKPVAPDALAGASGTRVLAAAKAVARDAARAAIHATTRGRRAEPIP